MSSAALHDGTLAVPVIDITSFRMPYADETVRAGIVRQVDEAARTVGFMQIGHGITDSATDAFFALDAEVKQRTAARPASTAATPRRRRRACPAASGWPARPTSSRR